jgi:hypothetical protein
MALTGHPFFGSCFHGLFLLGFARIFLWDIDEDAGFIFLIVIHLYK